MLSVSHQVTSCTYTCTTIACDGASHTAGMVCYGNATLMHSLLHLRSLIAIMADACMKVNQVRPPLDLDLPCGNALVPYLHAETVCPVFTQQLPGILAGCQFVCFLLASFFPLFACFDLQNLLEKVFEPSLRFHEIAVLGKGNPCLRIAFA